MDRFDPKDRHPIDIFDEWMNDAKNEEPNNPNAMCLSTVDQKGKPSSRMVLLKQYDKGGFVFYTNSHSRKGKELTDNPHVSLCIYWKSRQRQVRIEGTIEIVSREMTQDYFNSRFRGSQIASYASLQSQPLPDKQVYQDKIQEIEKQYEGSEVIPCPDHWNGYRVIPNTIELWMEGEFRTHDRFAFKTQDQENWSCQRLYP